MSDIFTLLKLLCEPAWAAGTELLDSYQRAFAETVIGDSSLGTLAFWRGRVALWTILRAIGVEEGDEVILSAYTCEMVPAAVRFAGAKCVYVDVASSGFNAAAGEITAAVSERTRAIICQHTYGVPMPVHAIANAVKGRNVTLIEDCCQFISYDEYREVASTGAAAFFSTQWSKPYSTGLGGMAVFRDDELYRRAQEIRDGFGDGGCKSRSRSLAGQFLLHCLTVRPKTSAVIAVMYRWAQQHGLVRGTTMPDEYGLEMPSEYLAGATNVQAELGQLALQQWHGNVAHRHELTELYVNGLAEMEVDVATVSVGRQTALWAVPILVENKEDILRYASRAGLPIHTWFGRTPLHMDAATASRYNYSPGQCPRAERLFRGEVHLITAPSVTRKDAQNALALLRRKALLRQWPKGGEIL